MCERIVLIMTRLRVIVLLVLTALILLPGPVTVARALDPCDDPELSIDQRVATLLSQMTVAEKIAQMDMLSGRPLANTVQLDTTLAHSLVSPDGVGSIHDFYPASASLANELQAFIIANNRLGIPALFIEETLHGYVQPGSTTFPIPLALAATWDPELVEQTGHAIASEARAHGTHAGLSPVLGIARDPRWGRVEETFGEDTYLASALGTAMVRGMQGDKLCAPDAIVSVVKHFAVHSQPTSGTNSSPVSVGKRDALQFFLPVFHAAIGEGGARGVMSAYSEWNGVPCTGDSWLLTDLLRDQWGFDGFTLADMGAIRMLATCHFTTDSPGASLQRAVSAGMDMQFYDFPSGIFRSELLALVESGELSMADLDRAAGDILRVKFELGLFDNPYVDPDHAQASSNDSPHRELARQAARESIVLLQNDGVLPFSDDVKRIALIGPAGTSDYTGGYSPRNASAVTLYDGLAALRPEGVQMRYESGVSFLNAGNSIPSPALWTEDEASLGLDAEYFDNPDLAGEPVLTRIDPAVDFNWDTHSPAEGLPPDSFSVRWTGWLKPTQDVHGWIGVSSDDGSRLWLDGKLVIDTWDTGVTIRRHEVHLRAGERYAIRMEYRENLWGASASLRWNVGAEDMDAAVALAEWADVAVVAVGENDMLVGENRDRLSLELSGNQAELVRRVAASGTPVVLTLISGRPIALGDLTGRVNAIAAAWFGGEQAGLALAEVLYGQIDPSGRLPITFPRQTGQVPCNYNHKPSKILRYVDGDARPAFPFGHGLTYTSFEYSNLRLQTRSCAPEDTVRFSVDVRNTGTRDATAVVQVYINDRISSVTTPVKELKAFQRVPVAASATQTVYVAIPVERFALINAELDRVVEPGRFDLMIGESSEDIRLTTSFTVE